MSALLWIRVDLCSLVVPFGVFEFFRGRGFGLQVLPPKNAEIAKKRLRVEGRPPPNARTTRTARRQHGGRRNLQARCLRHVCFRVFGVFRGELLLASLALVFGRRLEKIRTQASQPSQSVFGNATFGSSRRESAHFSTSFPGDQSGLTSAATIFKTRTQRSFARSDLCWDLLGGFMPRSRQEKQPCCWSLVEGCSAAVTRSALANGCLRHSAFLVSPIRRHPQSVVQVHSGARATGPLWTLALAKGFMRGRTVLSFPRPKRTECPRSFGCG